METIKQQKYIILAAAGTCCLLYADYLTYGWVKISLLTMMFGFVPLIVQIGRSFRKMKTKNPN